jgi:hypothetical protein
MTLNFQVSWYLCAAISERLLELKDYVYGRVLPVPGFLRVEASAYPLEARPGRVGLGPGDTGFSRLFGLCGLRLAPTVLG